MGAPPKRPSSIVTSNWRASSRRSRARSRGSRRHKRLQRRTHQMLEKRKRRIRDLCHKATRQVAKAFPNATCYVGEPFTEAAQRIQAHPSASRRNLSARPVRASSSLNSTTRRLARLPSAKPIPRRHVLYAGAEQAAQDLPLPIVRRKWPARRDRRGQYPLAWRTWRHAPRSDPAAAGQVSAPLAPPAAQ